MERPYGCHGDRPGTLGWVSVVGVGLDLMVGRTRPIYMGSWRIQVDVLCFTHNKISSNKIMALGYIHIHGN